MCQVTESCREYAISIEHIIMYICITVCLLIISEEMFNGAEAMWFSKNGKYLAVATFNDTNVDSAIFPYYGEPSDFNNQYPEIVKFKYPKVKS